MTVLQLTCDEGAEKTPTTKILPSKGGEIFRATHLELFTAMTSVSIRPAISCNSDVLLNFIFFLCWLAMNRSTENRFTCFTATSPNLDIRRFAVVVTVFLLFTLRPTSAQQLPVRAWTIADGLPQNHVDRIRLDRRGYLWICDGDGLARFDGHSFVNYNEAQGLPKTAINDFLETRNGTYWLATDRGLCQFDPRGQAVPHQPGQPPPSQNQPKRMFTLFPLGEWEAVNRVNVLLEDPDGSVWVATSGGLFRLQQSGGQVRIEEVEIGFPTGILEKYNRRHVVKLYFDSHGTLWAPSISGLYRRPRGGNWERYGTEHGLPANFVQCVFEDRHGRFWVGSREQGLFLLVANPQPGQRVLEKHYSPANGFPGRDIRTITPSTDGRMWLASSNCLILFDPDASDDRKVLRFTTEQGLSTNEIYNLIRDSADNLWLGTRNNGIMRIAGSGFTTFGPADGYTPGGYNTITESRAGELLIYNGTSLGSRFFHFFDGKRFFSAEHKLARGFNGADQEAILQDHSGDWWIAVNQRLLRYANVKTITELAKAKPKAIYGEKEGLDNVLSVFEDSRGDIWIGCQPGTKPHLYRWERATNKLQAFVSPAERPPVMGEDAEGNLWLSRLGTPGVARYRNGQFKLFTPAAGAPPGLVHSFFLDSRKRFWLCANSGLFQFEEELGDRLRLTLWDLRDGVYDNEVFSVTEDQWGRIYAGTTRGVVRLDPVTKAIRRFDSADGVAKGEVRVTLRDHHNRLWFVTEQGVSRLIPRLEEMPPPPFITFTSVRVNGARVPMSELGETKMEHLTFAPDQTSVQIDFSSPDLSPGARLRYQYQFNAQDWSAPSESRTVSFANLAPGKYSFAARAINPFGVKSNSPATITFTIKAPIWQRWWFVMLVALSLGLMIYAAVRYHFEQRLAVERVRMRLATDLHDDIGASLSEVAVLSEVVNRRVVEHLPVAEPLALIGETSRDMLDAMNDIVWANNPRYDNLKDLTRRLRHFAVELLEARGIEFNLALPDENVDLQLGGELRQQVFLIGKEAVNNVVRHSGATQAEIELKIEDSSLTLRVADNGRGFVANESDTGNGLRSMRSRAADIGGELDITSSPDGGTQLTLRVSLHARRKLSHLFRWGGWRRQ